MLRRLVRVVFWSTFAVATVAGLVLLAVWRELTQDLPAVTELLDYRPPTATRVYAADGTLVGEFYLERRYLVPMDQIPARVRHARRPHDVQLACALDKLFAGHQRVFARHERLDIDVGQLTPETDRARQNQRFARDVDAREIDTRIRLRITSRDRGAERRRI